MADALFADPRQAGVYDALEPDRDDLDAYVAMVDELDARSVLDVGCGTGTFACRLAQRGLSVVGVDPAAASLEVARRRPGAEKVRWLHGDAGVVGEADLDLATMTGNVAQVFVDDADWRATLTAVRGALGRGGRLVFETRVPTQEAWRRWTPRATRRQADIPGIGVVERWEELTNVALPLVSFRTTTVFESDGAVLTSASTLRFRDREEVSESLAATGFDVADIRDAPDRPGLEMVFVAVRRRRRCGRG